MGRGSVLLKQSLLGFVASALMLPGALAFATVLLVITSPHGAKDDDPTWNSFLNRTPARSCLYGTLLGLGFCVLLGVVAGRRFSRADSACPGPFDELCRRVDRAKKRFDAIPATEDRPAAEGPRAEADKHLRYLRDLLELPSQPDRRWLFANGYTDAWRRLHAVEEALVFLEPVPLLLADAFTDEARLEGSGIPQRPALLERLRLGVTSLSSTAASYLSELSTPADKGQAQAETASDTKAPDHDEARSALVQVRAAINEFRDGQREAIIGARNRLFGTVVFVGVTGCILLDIAILSDAPKSSIEAVAAFYLVGGLVGLVRQLQIAAGSEGAGQDDYELGAVRLVFTPQFSGLAAIGGVVLVMLTGNHGSFSLNSTFDLDTNAYGLISAAIFGLTPSLLFTGLQQRIDQYQADLKKSNAGQASSTSG